MSDNEKNINEPEKENENNNTTPGNKQETASDGNSAAALENEVAGLKDKLLRKAAEFENYKRRTENDQLNLIKYGAESFIAKLLPVVDDFERSLQHIQSAKDLESVKAGVQLIYDKFVKMLDEQGVKKFESVGKPFNVEYHEALMQRKDEKAAPHIVLDEFESGYLYKDKVIRHAKVVVNEDSASN